jgi:hypothetical protein
VRVASRHEKIAWKAIETRRRAGRRWRPGGHARARKGASRRLTLPTPWLAVGCYGRAGGGRGVGGAAVPRLPRNASR